MNIQENEHPQEIIKLEDLPTDVLLQIFSYCDEISLGRLSQQCRRFSEIVRSNWLWKVRSEKAIVTNQLSQKMQQRRRIFCHAITFPPLAILATGRILMVVSIVTAVSQYWSMLKLSFHEKCRISLNWRKGRYAEHIYFSQRTRFMPWIVLNSDYVWLSRGRDIFCYRRTRDGIHSRYAVLRFRGHAFDVCRFVETNDMIISGGSDLAICVWSIYTGSLVIRKSFCHTSDINSVSVVNDMLVSGSKDRTIKMWRLQVEDSDCVSLHTFDVKDRVWSTSISPHGNQLACGTAGDDCQPPLHLYDLERAYKVMSYKESFLPGAAVLDVIWESSHLFYSAGFDGCLRLWDTRTQGKINTWEDPYDASLYCIATDHAFTVLCGTWQHGRVQLWDIRQQRGLQMYFMNANNNSPVYSVAFDASHMFVGLDVSMNVMDFSGKGNATVDWMNR